MGGSIAPLRRREKIAQVVPRGEQVGLPLHERDRHFIVVGGIAERVGERGVHPRGDGVLLFAPIELEGDDAGVTLHEKVRVGHWSMVSGQCVRLRISRPASPTGMN